MREEVALFGFTRSDAGSYSTGVMRSDKRMAIAVSSGDEVTVGCR